LLTAEPYAQDIIPVPPHRLVRKPRPFVCGQNALRSPAATKGRRYRKTILSSAACAPGSGCC